jgi:TRAP-type C4-dicarboxylate transport system permease large subunit
VLGGARAPETTAIIAAPTVLAASYGYFGDFSLARLILAVAIPAAAALALLAPLYLFAPARAVTPWLAGPALAIGVAAPLAAGFLTPTETAGLYAVFALAGGLPIRRFGLRRKLGPLLRQAGMETVSIAIVVATAMLVAAAIGLLSAQPHWSDIGVPARTAVLLGGGGFFVLAVLLTPALALVALIVLSHAVESAGLDPVWIGTVATLLGLAAMALRAVRGKAGAAAASSLPPGPALAATAVFLVLAGGIAFWPDIVMAPIDALLG